MSRRGRHTTIIEGLEPVVKVLEKNGIGISPGEIKTGLPSGQHRMKIRQLSGGVELVFRSTRTRQILHLYGDGETIEQIVHEWGRRESVPVLAQEEKE